MSVSNYNVLNTSSCWMVIKSTFIEVSLTTAPRLWSWWTAAMIDWKNHIATTCLIYIEFRFFNFFCFVLKQLSPLALEIYKGFGKRQWKLLLTHQYKLQRQILIW